MEDPNPKAIIEELVESGMTEVAIADALKDMDVDVTQATINRLKNGRHKTTSFDIGFGLVKLRAQRMSEQRSRA